MKTRKVVASAVAAATLGMGGLAVAATNPLAGAGAEEPPPPGGPPGRERHRPGEVLTSALDGLVAKGTLTRAQADAVVGAVKAEVGERPDMGGHRHGHRRHADRRQVVATAAKAIGISPEDLAAALGDGKSIADVATANDVDPASVVKALVDAGTARVDAAVKAGRLKAEQAAGIKERLPEMAERIVEHKEPSR